MQLALVPLALVQLALVQSLLVRLALVQPLLVQQVEMQRGPQRGQQLRSGKLVFAASRVAPAMACYLPAERRPLRLVPVLVLVLGQAQAELRRCQMAAMTWFLAACAEAAYAGVASAGVESAGAASAGV